MLIDFEEQTETGEVKFFGELSKEEVDYLLRYALLSLLQRGMLPNMVVSEHTTSETVN